jgi:hypothetical protein
MEAQVISIKRPPILAEAGFWEVDTQGTDRILAPYLVVCRGSAAPQRERALTRHLQGFITESV